MLPHLPEAIFWDILKRTDDVKSCVTVWSTCKDLQFKYNPEKFWETMCYHHYDTRSKPKLVSTWRHVYWWHYKDVKGCAYCQRAILKDTCKADTVNIHGNDVFVCKRCKNILGDTMIHDSMLDTWQIALIRKLKTPQAGPLFAHYYGDNQVQKCHSFQMKCVQCIKNIRNVRCPLSQCGRCCQCKYHKSHYDQAAPDDCIMSFDIVQLLHKAPCHKKNRKLNVMIVHRY